MEQEGNRDPYEGFEEFLIKEGKTSKVQSRESMPDSNQKENSSFISDNTTLKFDRVFYADTYALVCNVFGSTLTISKIALSGYQGEGETLLRNSSTFSANIVKDLIFLDCKQSKKIECSLIVPLCSGIIHQTFIDSEGFVFSHDNSYLINNEFYLNPYEEMGERFIGLQMIEEISTEVSRYDDDISMRIISIHDHTKVMLYVLKLSSEHRDYQCKIDVRGDEMKLKNEGILSTIAGSMPFCGSGRKEKGEKRTIEGVKYFGKFLVCFIENSDGEFVAKLMNIANGNIIAKRALPFITYQFEYEVQ